ncbi:MAG: hypothetical protein AB7O52_12365 [Planctomycetota bacterium]
MRKLLALALVVGFTAPALGTDISRNSHFQRGDTNQDFQINIGDAINLLSFLFPPAGGGPVLECQDAADVNDDGNLNIADAVSLLAFLFSGAAAPPAPFTYYGADPTLDALGCKTIPGPVAPASHIVGGGTGLVTANTVLTNDRTWLIDGLTFVEPGVTLTIEPGTTIVGNSTSVTPSVLTFRRGDITMTTNTPNAMANFMGQVNAPVVFTSELRAGRRAPGNWGGVVFLGRAKNNIVDNGGEGEVEGLTGEFFGGGPGNLFANDNSGSIRFTRVEFGGFELSPNNEINSITLAAVGSATTFDHVQVKRNLDDGFEWFGGDVNGKFLIASFIDDDDVDYSFGYCGKLQFVVSHKASSTSDNGIEADNTESNFTNVPKTNPLIANISLIGRAHAADGTFSSASSDVGMLQRRGVNGNVFNWIVSNWERGLQVTQQETCDGMGATALGAAPAASANLINDWGLEARDVIVEDIVCTAPGGATSFWFGLMSNNVCIGGGVDSARSPVVSAEFDATAIGYDFRTKTNAALTALNPAIVFPAPDPAAIDPFFTSAPYYGAVDPNATAASAWTAQLWTDYTSN